MSASYPNSVKTFTNPTAANNLNNPDHATQHADANDEIAAIETELGALPKGSYTSVKARLDDMAWPKNIQVFTSSGTWSRPSGKNYAYVKVWGGGGGGAGSASGTSNCGGGGGGGYAEGYIAVTGDVAVTVGAGGAGGAINSNGSAGGTSSFAGSTTIQATGGSGGSTSGVGGAGGAGSNGQINLSGNQGQAGLSAQASGRGGSTVGFTSDAYETAVPGSGSNTGNSATVYGCGGSGSQRTTGSGAPGGAGAGGYVIVYC